MEVVSSSPLPNPNPHSFSNPKPQWTYDVFINFRGADTRRKFVCHLYHALSNAGVNTFLDDQKLDKGKKLEKLIRAIEGSQIAIVVFSINYTKSTWCLDELARIIECDETHGQRVLPVFYYIDPSVVRYQKGAFGEALKATAQKRYSGKHMELALSRWSRALTEAAKISGWEAMNYGNEAELVTKIVEDVLTKLDYKVLSVTEFPVGLETRGQKVIRFIETTKYSCAIGIWGMGGSGKTTIAKDIYNQIHRRFMHKSFIGDIRGVCQTDTRGKACLQGKLLSDILKTKVEIHSVGMGKTMIENRVAGKRALIVLDDVNEFDQLEALFGNTQWIGKGNVIIITTRDLRLLQTLKVDYVYETKEMDKNESLELFCWHAFREAKPREGFNELATNAVEYCEGLPLALKVLGSDLSSRAANLWGSELLKLQEIPNAKVQRQLRISFDGLCDRMEKNIFFDVCCAFIGKDRGCVTEILNDCGLFADIGITVLRERSLIKVEKNNKLRMHRLLREMGREIICEGSINEPGKCSRLWLQKHVLDVLTENTGTEAIEGLALNLLHSTSSDRFEAYAFEKMKRLRLLQLDHVQLIGDYGYLSKHLRWICWQGFPLEYIPDNFYLEYVIAIDFKHSNLRLVWKESKVLLWLKFLNLSHSKYLTETPDFSKLPRLEKLILKHCPSLCKVHQSIGDLRNLLLINLKGCTNLSNLPRETYKLKSLKTLILSGCSKIDKLEEDIVQMESLTTLIAENTSVKKVPFSIVSSKSIGYLFLCGYEGLSHNVFPSIIWSWMSPTMSPLSRIRPFCGISSSLVSMNMQNNDLDDLAPILSSLLNLRSVLVQCDTEFQISQQVRTILDEVHGVNLTELDITPYTSEISKHSLRPYLIGFGSYQEVFNTLRRSIPEELATSESCYFFIPGDNYPYWFAHTGDGHSVYFTMPGDCRLKGMTLCVVYLPTSETAANECLISVLMVNYTKCTIQIYKRGTVISFNDVDWQGIISHLGAGDRVEIFVAFGHGLVVKKTAVYLLYDEWIDMEIEPISKPPVKKVYSRRRKRGDMPESQLEQDPSYIGPKRVPHKSKRWTDYS